MVLLEHCPQLLDWDVQILATDINKRALRQAREGIYRSRALRQTEEILLERYFRRVGDHFVLDQRVRSLVRFGYLNLQADPYPHADNGTTDLDLIFCRNVLIYFQAETIRQIIGRFSDCLRPHGYLFLGHAETLQGISDRFQRHHQHGAFFYQRKLQDKVRPALPPPEVVVSPPSPPPAVAPSKVPGAPSAKASSPAPEVKPAPSSPAPFLLPDRDRAFAAAMAAFDRENFPAAEKLFDQLLANHPEDAPALVGKGLILANQGRYDEARQWCARAIRYDDLCPAAYLLRGLILDMEGQLERALVEYQKVLWLDREFVMAYYFSAKINSRLGRVDQQLRALRNAIRILEKQEGGGIIPFSGGVSRPVLLEICRKELTAIQPRL
jgi:chemotaxis protein methyltransferase CheR